MGGLQCGATGMRTSPTGLLKGRATATRAREMNEGPPIRALSTQKSPQLRWFDRNITGWALSENHQAPWVLKEGLSQYEVCVHKMCGLSAGRVIKERL